jgi:hypothetical protein
MFTLAAIGIFFGVALGLRFKVFILVPTIGLAVAVVAVSTSGDGSSQVSIAMIVIATCLQLGYFIGAVMRSMRRLQFRLESRACYDTPKATIRATVKDSRRTLPKIAAHPR